MHGITSPDHQRLSRKLKQLYSRYERSRDLINVGAYSAGSDPVLDEAIRKYPQIQAFLQQEITEKSSISQSLAGLSALFDA
jgi:flagellum-specific ATP synthase